MRLFFPLGLILGTSSFFFNIGAVHLLSIWISLAFFPTVNLEASYFHLLDFKMNPKIWIVRP